MNKLTLICIILIGAVLQAAPITFPDNPINLDRATAKRLLVVGFAGQVVINPLPAKTNTVSVKVSRFIDKEELPNGMTDNADILEYLRQATVKAQVVGDAVEVRVELPSSKSDWTTWTQGHHIPQVKLEISSPENMPTEIYLAHGDVAVKKMKAPVFVTHQDGHIVVEDILADVTARTMFGTDRFENIKGGLSVENFSALLTISGITGQVRVRTFTGEVRAKGLNGSILITSEKGTVTTDDTIGSMEVHSGAAAIHVVDHKGTVTGHSESGSIEAKVIGPVEAQLTSETGALTVSASHESQADVTLLSHGAINAPKILSHKRSSTGRVVRGSLQGTQPGRIRLNSESGELNIKVF